MLQYVHIFRKTEWIHPKQVRLLLIRPINTDILIMPKFILIFTLRRFDHKERHLLCIAGRNALVHDSLENGVDGVRLPFPRWTCYKGMHRQAVHIKFYRNLSIGAFLFTAHVVKIPKLDKSALLILIKLDISSESRRLDHRDAGYGFFRESQLDRKLSSAYNRSRRYLIAVQKDKHRMLKLPQILLDDIYMILVLPWINMRALNMRTITVDQPLISACRHLSRHWIRRKEICRSRKYTVVFTFFKTL